jgi:hypothetical protein
MKGYNGPSILCAVLLFGAVLVSQAFADMGKIDDAELSRINASVTGISVKKQINCVEKDGTCLETKQNSVTSNNVAAPSPSVRGITNEAIDLNLNISGQTTFQFYFGGSTSNVTGSITSVKSR